MLPQDKNGVVDPELKVCPLKLLVLTYNKNCRCYQVYGTLNVRVADLSVIPMAVAAHTQTLAYYVGEMSEW